LFKNTDLGFLQGFGFDHFSHGFFDFRLILEFVVYGPPKAPAKVAYEAEDKDKRDRNPDNGDGKLLDGKTLVEH